MDRDTVIQKTVDFVKDELLNAEGGHDWWHVYRVWKLARQIARTEEADLFVVELGALLHDIADSKFHNGDETIGPRKARQFLGSIGVEENVIAHVEQIIAHISFKGAAYRQAFRSAELDVVQDADRLDALGAIGVARAFNYGGHKGRAIYDPGIPPVQEMTKDAYKINTSPTINHFYEKLLLLKDRMNTQTGKKLAGERHRYMEQFLSRFYAEWEGTETF